MMQGGHSFPKHPAFSFKLRLFPFFLPRGPESDDFHLKKRRKEFVTSDSHRSCFSRLRCPDPSSVQPVELFVRYVIKSRLLLLISWTVCGSYHRRQWSMGRVARSPEPSINIHLSMALFFFQYFPLPTENHLCCCSRNNGSTWWLTTRQLTGGKIVAHTDLRSNVVIQTLSDFLVENILSEHKDYESETWCVQLFVPSRVLISLCFDSVHLTFLQRQITTLTANLKQTRLLLLLITFTRQRVHLLFLFIYYFIYFWM